jgi:hypothetical protein
MEPLDRRWRSLGRVCQKALPVERRKLASSDRKSRVTIHETSVLYTLSHSTPDFIELWIWNTENLLKPGPLTDGRSSRHEH